MEQELTLIQRTRIFTDNLKEQFTKIREAITSGTVSQHEFHAILTNQQLRRIRENTSLEAFKNIRRNLYQLHIVNTPILQLQRIQRTSLDTTIFALIQTLDLLIEKTLLFELTANLEIEIQVAEEIINELLPPPLPQQN